MPADSVLVIDAGTSALRALAVRADGRVTPFAAEPWPMFVPDDAAPFGREFDVAGVRLAFERLIEAAAPYRDAVAVVAVTGQREGIAVLDARGEALFASPNIDARASEEGMGSSVWTVSVIARPITRGAASTRTRNSRTS